MIELRCGDWRDVLADVTECDAVITDPPYSQRTEDGVRSGSTMKDQRNQVGMGYHPIDEKSASRFCKHWGPRCGWVLVCCDHITWRWFDDHMDGIGRYTFPPVVIAKHGAAPRMCADGPASQCEYIAVSRPRSSTFVGFWPGIPGWYAMQTVRHGHDHCGVRGAKSIETMRAIIRDYTKPGDLIIDPFAGSGTTLIAARQEGRDCIGAEIDPETYAKAKKRIEKPYTQELF